MIARGTIRLTMLLTLLASGAAGLAAAEDDAADLHRRTMTAEDERTRRTVALARLLVSAGRAADARPLYEQALLLRPDDLDVAEELLDVLRHLGDLDAELALARRLTTVRVGAASLSMRMGACLWGLKRYDEARAVWADVLKRYPAGRDLYDELTDFYLAENRPTDAAAMIARRRERFDEDAAVLLAEGRLAFISGETSGAIDVLLRCLDRDLGDGERRRAERLLFTAARRAGAGNDVTARLRTRLATLDARLAGRLIERAEAAAARKDFAEAATLARRALPLLNDPARRAHLTARITLWNALH